MNLEDIRGSKQYDNIYLIGNGDSLDVRTLKNPSFACNLIDRIYPETEWRPHYYICTDTMVLDNYEVEVRENIAAAKIAFVPVEAMPKYSLQNVVPIIVKHEPFEDEITEGIYCYATTLHPPRRKRQNVGFWGGGGRPVGGRPPPHPQPPTLQQNYPQFCQARRGVWW